MMQMRTHTCNALRLADVGKSVKIVGWMENVREVGGSLAFVVLRDFYGTTQVVVEDEADLKVIKGLNKESTISVEGTVRERASKNPKLPTGEIEVVPTKIEVLGRCRYNALPFEINRSREADETQRLKYRYLDLRNPAVKQNIILRCQVVAALRANDHARVLVTGCAAAIDLGTTTTALRLYDLATGHALATCADWTALAPYGADVITRIQYTIDHQDGLTRLSSLLRQQLKALLTRALSQAGRQPAELKRTVTAGNTVMQSLLAGVSVRPLAVAPFCPETFFRQSSGLTLLDAPLYCVPCAAGFVGGDITAGLLASGLARRAGHFLFLDIGTNGEMALGGMDGFTCCAVAAGPAFEGAGIACGMLGVDGAVSRVRYSGAFKMNVIGGGEAAGLCGSGLIDLTALLLRLGVIDEGGRLLPPEDAPEAFRRYLTRDENGCGVFHLTDRVYLTAADVRALQLAKAAVAAGVQILLAQQGLTLSALDGLYLSGGFGMYLDPASAAAIGMLPRLPAAKLHSVGNAALSGAAQLALRGDMSAADGIVNRLTYLELSGRPDFADAFAKNIPLRPMQWR